MEKFLFYARARGSRHQGEYILVVVVVVVVVVLFSPFVKIIGTCTLMKKL